MLTLLFKFFRVERPQRLIVNKVGHDHDHPDDAGGDQVIVIDENVIRKCDRIGRRPEPRAPEEHHGRRCGADDDQADVHEAVC